MPDRTGKTVMLMRGPFTALVFGMLALFSAVTGTAGQDANVLVVKSIDAPIYDEVVAAFSRNLKALCTPNCTIGELSSITRDELFATPDTDLVVSIGRLAGLAVAEVKPDAAIYGLIPRTTWNEIVSCCPETSPPHATALFLDQPIDRQLHLIRVLLPQARRIAVLFGTHSISRLEEVQLAAERAGLELVSRRVDDSDEVGPELDIMLDDVDALLAIPDSTIYNRDTIYGVLLTTYRRGVPVFGYAKSLVDAGAVAAIYTSPEDVGRQLAAMAADYLSNDSALPPPRMPSEFSVAINKRVMRSLGLPVPSEQTVHRQLQELER